MQTIQPSKSLLIVGLIFLVASLSAIFFVISLISIPLVPISLYVIVPLFALMCLTLAAGALNMYFQQFFHFFMDCYIVPTFEAQLKELKELLENNTKYQQSILRQSSSFLADFGKTVEIFQTKLLEDFSIVAEDVHERKVIAEKLSKLKEEAIANTERSIKHMFKDLINTIENDAKADETVKEATDEAVKEDLKTSTEEIKASDLEVVGEALKEEKSELDKK